MRNSWLKMSLVAADLASPLRFQQPDLHHLSRVVPFIYRGIDIQAFVALKPDELGSEDLGQRTGHLGFPDACLALEQERSLQLERQKERRCQVGIGDVALGAEG